MLYSMRTAIAANGCEHVTLGSICLRIFRKIIILDQEKHPIRKMQQFYMLAVVNCRNYAQRFPLQPTLKNLCTFGMIETFFAKIKDINFRCSSFKSKIF